MKKIVLIIFVVMASTAVCQTVSRELAETAAIHHFRNHYTSPVLPIATTPCFKDGVLCFYHVTMSNGAWCFVSSSLLVEPILMYGISLNNKFWRSG